MEGKNVEENKDRDKWSSLCVSCGERPRLINRRIDTRYIRPKGERKKERGRGKNQRRGGLSPLGGGEKKRKKENKET